MSLNTKYDILDNRLVIRRLNAGDRQCFEACYRFYYKGLCSFASRWVSLPVAEDIVQDTMLYIWENRDRLMEELSLKGLLFMIVRNKAFDRIAHRQVRQRVHQLLCNCHTKTGSSINRTRSCILLCKCFKNMFLKFFTHSNSSIRDRESIHYIIFCP